MAAVGEVVSAAEFPAVADGAGRAETAAVVVAVAAAVAVVAPGRVAAVAAAAAVALNAADMPAVAADTVHSREGIDSRYSWGETRSRVDPFDCFGRLAEEVVAFL